MKRAFFVVAALALSGCVSHNFSEGERANYSCDGGKQFSSRRVAPALEVYALGATYRLEPAADGQYRSGDGAITYSETGGRVTLAGVGGGPLENCRRSMRWSRFF